MKLQSAVDFCKDLFKKWDANEITSEQFVVMTDAYCSFLKQLLTLGMFVPCDLEGNVLEEPDGDNYKSDEEKEIPNFDYLKYKNDSKEYQEAKDRVLFKGFEFKGYSEFSFIFKYKGTFPTMIPKINIELLANRYKDIELTPTAQKQIGLI